MTLNHLGTMAGSDPPAPVRAWDYLPATVQPVTCGDLRPPVIDQLATERKIANQFRKDAGR